MNTPAVDTLSKEKIEAIARVCHESNRAWCAAHGDFSQKPWEEAEDWQKESTFEGIRFRLKNPDAGYDVQHMAWLKGKIAGGWVFGEKKDAALKTHPCILPFEELPDFEKKKDILFAMVVMALK